MEDVNVWKAVPERVIDRLDPNAHAGFCKFDRVAFRQIEGLQDGLQFPNWVDITRYKILMRARTGRAFPTLQASC